MQKTLAFLCAVVLSGTAICQSVKEGYGPGKRPVFEFAEDSVAFAETSTAFKEYRQLDKSKRPADFDSLSSVFYHLIGRAKGFVYEPKYSLLSSLTNENRASVTAVTLEKVTSRKLPAELLMCKNLERLEIINSSVGYMQKELDGLTHLRNVELLNNVPRRRLRFARNAHITRLVIRGNKRRSFPRSYRHLDSLGYLDVSNNSLEKFPGIYRNKKIRFLFAGGNALTLHDLRHKEQRSLQVLDLRYNHITTVPKTIRYFPELISLALMNNAVHKIGAGFERLQKLENLSLYNNQLDEIPASFYSLGALNVLDLYYNHIRTVDPGIGRLKNLTDLHLAHNLIDNLPAELGTLSNLRGLYINNNHLTALPESVKSLSQLKEIRVGNNYLTLFPGQLLTLRSMRWVDINNNQLKTLPSEISSFKNLDILSLYGNPWDDEMQKRLPGLIAHFQSQGTKVLTIVPAEEETLR